jgi:hypothetical protein
MRIRSFTRALVALWYLFGWPSHIYLALFAPDTYRVFGATALIPGFPDLWRTLIMPNITVLAFVVAGFEVVVGALLISRGRWVKVGLGLSLLFNLFLVQLGLGYTAPSLPDDFLVNRLPNLVFIGLQLPLVWGYDDRSLLAPLRDWWRATWGLPKS